MTRSMIVILLVLLLIGGSIGALVLTDIPAPKQPIQKTLDNERFLKP